MIAKKIPKIFFSIFTSVWIEILAPQIAPKIPNIEIIIAFLTIPCIVLVIKRKLVGSLAYLLIYGLYFGNHLFNGIITMLEGEAMTMEVSLNLLSDFVAIILALFVFMDMLVDKSRKANPIDKKTDWYFKNEKYDEELNARDSREDKNQYKFY